MRKRCEVRIGGRSKWSDECGRVAVTTDRNGSPLCDKHACLFDKSATPNDDIRHITWLIKDVLEADGETTRAQVKEGEVSPEFCSETVDTWADGLVIHLGNGEMYEVAIRRIE